MRRLIVLAALSLLSAPAFAQGSLEQPATNDDGVGIDYTQPFVNDLLLRTEPLMLGDNIADGARLACEKTFNAWKDDPTNAVVRGAHMECVREYGRQWWEENQRSRPGMRFEPYRLEPAAPPPTRRLPLSPSHPNAQN